MMQLFNTVILALILTCVTAQSSSYTCSQNSSTVEFSLFSSFHSAWNSVSNCSLVQCASYNDNCRLSQTPCFDYRTINNTSYCAPASLCSILSPCNNSTNGCSSNTSVCVVNSCCSPRTVCLPLSWTTFCPMAGQFFSIMKEFFFLRQLKILVTTTTMSPQTSSGI